MRSHERATPYGSLPSENYLPGAWAINFGWMDGVVVVVVGFIFVLVTIYNAVLMLRHGTIENFFLSKSHIIEYDVVKIVYSFYHDFHIIWITDAQMQNRMLDIAQSKKLSSFIKMRALVLRVKDEKLC